ncbi:FecCD family ABC transporter permease [Nitrincola nitratireducens]|uniref:Iron-uptake system permease protein FeuC n=1 Tax=Nitrincola nitratireducens TaxID=1229521 RepID=W9VFY7_9GAMM|nr:iron ABC transporter permease [Nitrincola nitratireducens]EXJ09600.1 Iron-uptake system permease protein FeuC [Nitrincola nitratireducens]
MERIITSQKYAAYGLLIALMVTLSLSLTQGAISLNIWQVLGVLTGSIDDAFARLVVLDIRLPRVLLGAIVGAGLAIAGASMQGLFRNPLADPGLVGVSSGAALAAILVIVLGGTYLKQWMSFWGYFALPLAAFMGGVLVTWVIYKVATFQGRTDIATMLLAGVAINAITGAISGVLTYYASDEALRSLTFWSMGSLASASWVDVAMAGIPILVACCCLPFFSRALNAFLMGETVSHHMGFNVKRMKQIVIALTALAVGSAVAVSGVIGFVGLVAPHLVRLLTGPDHRWVLPLSAMMGAVLVVLSDVVARLLIAPAELPIGLVMASVGGPFFLGLLLKQRAKSGF